MGAVADRVRRACATFVIEPSIRFNGEVGEQAPGFLSTLPAIPLEFKTFADISQLFAK
jgi:extradiol dioxygenase family protein